VSKTEFGDIKKVEVRSIWQNEQYNFTPWLAEEENIGKLASALGVELEVEGAEVAVGPYSADILARDVGTGRFVVIENQFGRTNHDHLGKLITYGSFLDVSAVVWLAEDFTEEHQKALDWLNDHTTEDLDFYGVALELWQIDGSRPAIRFNVVSRPNAIVKQAAAAKATGPLSDARKLQLDFWTAFRERLLAKKVVSTAQTPRPQYWFDVALGRSSFVLSNIANTYENRIGLRVYMSNKIAEAALNQLLPQKDAIEKELGEKLLWNPNPDKRDKTITLYRNVDLDDREQWPEYCEWLVDRVAKFRKVFGPRIKSLKLSPVGDGENEGPHGENKKQ